MNRKDSKQIRSISQERKKERNIAGSISRCKVVEFIAWWPLLDRWRLDLQESVGSSPGNCFNSFLSLKSNLRCTYVRVSFSACMCLCGAVLVLLWCWPYSVINLTYWPYSIINLASWPHSVINLALWPYSVINLTSWSYSVINFLSSQCYKPSPLDYYYSVGNLVSWPYSVINLLLLTLQCYKPSHLGLTVFQTTSGIYLYKTPPSLHYPLSQCFSIQLKLGAVPVAK